MADDSTLTQPPDFGPTWPVYPELPQVCRVTSPPIVGSKPQVYPAFVQQWSPPLSLRDREACYVFEPNGVALGPAYYDTRLVGSYPPGQPGALPLYATTCCPLGGFGPSSSSSAKGH